MRRCQGLFGVVEIQEGEGTRVDWLGQPSFGDTFLVDVTILSKSPPHHGAFSRLNVQLTPLRDKYCLTSLWLKMASISFPAALNVLALSKMILLGSPFLAENHFRHQIKVVAVM